MILCRKLKKDMKAGSAENWDEVGDHHVFEFKGLTPVNAIVTRKVEGRRKLYTLTMLSTTEIRLEVQFASFDYNHTTGKSIELIFAIDDDHDIRYKVNI